jgi:hypothetical protein
MLMYTDYASVNHQIFKVGITGDSFKYPLPYTLMGPAVIANIHTMPVTIFRRQVTPGRTSAGNPENAFQKPTIVLCSNTTIGGFSWQ